jgi:hypothetical protein
VFLTKSYLCFLIKGDKIGVHVNRARILVGYLNVEDHLEGVGMDGSVILTNILKYDGKTWTLSCCSGQG